MPEKLPLPYVTLLMTGSFRPVFPLPPTAFPHSPLWRVAQGQWGQGSEPTQTETREAGKLPSAAPGGAKRTAPPSASLQAPRVVPVPAPTLALFGVPGFLPVPHPVPQVENRGAQGCHYSFPLPGSQDPAQGIPAPLPAARTQSDVRAVRSAHTQLPFLMYSIFNEVRGLLSGSTSVLLGVGRGLSQNCPPGSAPLAPAIPGDRV